MHVYPESSNTMPWVVLHALGVKAVQVPWIQRVGGPQLVLERWRDVGQMRHDGLLRRAPTLGQDEWETELACASVYGARVSDFVHRGGCVITPERAADWSVLSRASSPPLCWYGRGRALALALNTTPRIAIVGARAASLRGASRAHRYGERVAEAGGVVVSGGALGIDFASHRGALHVGGPTVAILGEPLRVSGDERPARLRELGSDLSTLTPFGPWVSTSRTLFAARNRFVAALVDAVWVIEAGRGSGTRHTVRAAQALGVPVWAVPGDPDDPLATLPNQWIAEGVATPMLDVHHAIERVAAARTNSSAQTNPASPASGQRVAGPRGARASTEFVPSDRRSPPDDLLGLCALLRNAGGKLDIEDLARHAAAPAAEVLAQLSALEILGFVRRCGGVVTLVTTSARERGTSKPVAHFCFAKHERHHG